MELLKLDTIEEAREKLLSCMEGRKPALEYIDLMDAPGRVLGEDIFAEQDIPAFTRSVVDGYAVSSADIAGAGEAAPVFLRPAGSVEMGERAAVPVRPGECVYIPTGAMLPDGADAVVMVEYTEAFGNDSIAVYDPAAAGSGIIRAGEDVRHGEQLLRRGVKIRPQELGALAAAGITRAPVYAPLDICIISTGDELVPPDQNPGPGEVRDINSCALHALARQNGCRVVSALALGDDEAVLEKAVREAMKVSRIVIISGGSSRGKKDLTADIISRIAKPGILTHGIAVKPGKPTIIGFDEKTGIILIGLPGHPVSAMMIFEILIIRAWETLTHQQGPFSIPAKISRSLRGSPGRAFYHPVRLIREGDAYKAEPVFGLSGMITWAAKADGYIIIDLNKEELKKDEQVLVALWA